MAAPQPAAADQPQHPSAVALEPSKLDARSLVRALVCTLVCTLVFSLVFSLVHPLVHPLVRAPGGDAR